MRRRGMTMAQMGTWCVSHVLDLLPCTVSDAFGCCLRVPAQPSSRTMYICTYICTIDGKSLMQEHYGQKTAPLWDKAALANLPFDVLYAVSVWVVPCLDRERHAFGEFSVIRLPDCCY
jgi:hypothetical protein